MQTKTTRREVLYEGRKAMLGSEEGTSNDLMADYSSKLNHLIAVKENIKALQRQREEMRQEQAEEERMLSEKEH